MLPVQSFVLDVEDLGVHDSSTDRCRVAPKIGLPEDVKMPAWLKAYNKVAAPCPRNCSHVVSHWAGKVQPRSPAAEGSSCSVLEASGGVTSSI